MPQVKVSLIQPTANERVVVPILTGLTADGKAGWTIASLSVQLLLPGAPGSGISALDVKLATVDAVTDPTNPDEIGRVSFRYIGGATTTAITELSTFGETVIGADRITVRPTLYAIVDSTGLSTGAELIFTVNYAVSKLSDSEMVRLFMGGA